MVDPISLNPNQQGSGKKNKTTFIIVILVIAAVIIGGILVFRQSKKIRQPEVTITETKEPSPTEKPKIDKNSVKFQVLNGTGTPGQAGVVVEALKKAGYNSDNIKTDNLEDFNNKITTIAAKDGFDNVASDIKDVLKATFDEIKIDSTPLIKDSEFDIVITTGGKKFEEVTPIPTLTPTPTP